MAPSRDDGAINLERSRRRARNRRCSLLWRARSRTKDKTMPAVDILCRLAGRAMDSHLRRDMGSNTTTRCLDMAVAELHASSRHAIPASNSPVSLLFSARTITRYQRSWSRLAWIRLRLSLYHFLPLHKPSYAPTDSSRRSLLFIPPHFEYRTASGL